MDANGGDTHASSETASSHQEPSLEAAETLTLASLPGPPLSPACWCHWATAQGSGSEEEGVLGRTKAGTAAVPSGGRLLTGWGL